MAYEPRDLTGQLFKNDRKEKDTHADYQGSILINGQDFWLSAWIKKGAKGTFMSLSAKPKQERAQEIRQESASRYGDDDSEIPF